VGKWWTLLRLWFLPLWLVEGWYFIMRPLTLAQLFKNKRMKMKRTYKKTIIGMAIVLGIILIVDILLLITDMPTISGTVLYYTFVHEWLIIPFFIGTLVTHFFLPNRLNVVGTRWWLIPIIGFSAAAILQLLNMFFPIHPLIVVGLGLVFGATIWNQVPSADIKSRHIK
jgi:hypothetical protein